jgi:hypothetical protein
VICVLVMVGPLLSTPTRLFDVVDLCTPIFGPAYLLAKDRFLGFRRAYHVLCKIRLLS